MNRASFVPPLSRQDALRDALLGTVELLERRRAGEIDEGYIADYVALHWLEWHGGSLRLTVTGRNVCAQLSGRTV
jgi:cytosine/adenosine deaminase-related metal-dependent hydrolase